MNKINFLEKTNVTYIIIGIFILFALIHLYKINSNTNEPFATISENSNVLNNVFIDIPTVNQLRFGNTGLNTLLDNKANVSDLASKANVSDLESKANVSDLAAKANISDLAVVTATANNAMPELSIIAFAGGNVLPLGWQLCNGDTLLYYNSIIYSLFYFIFSTRPPHF